MEIDCSAEATAARKKRDAPNQGNTVDPLDPVDPVDPVVTTNDAFPEEKDPTVDRLLNPGKQSANKAYETSMKTDYKKAIKDLVMEKAYENLFELMWYSQLPCFDVETISDKSDQRCSHATYWRNLLQSLY